MTITNDIHLIDSLEVAESAVVPTAVPADAASLTPRAPAPRFRTTAAFAARSRSQAPAIERATFVMFTIGGRRYAAAVEAVERVLRIGVGEQSPCSHVEYAGRRIPLADLAAALGASSSHTALTQTVLTQTALTRVLVVTVPGGWIGVAVDEVHEIATVDASGITPVDADEPAAALPGVRGRFVRHDVVAFVLDVARALGFRHG